MAIESWRRVYPDLKINDIVHGRQPLPRRVRECCIVTPVQNLSDTADGLLRLRFLSTNPANAPGWGRRSGGQLPVVVPRRPRS